MISQWIPKCYPFPLGKRRVELPNQEGRVEILRPVSHPRGRLLLHWRWLQLPGRLQTQVRWQSDGQTRARQRDSRRVEHRAGHERREEGSMFHAQSLRANGKRTQGHQRALEFCMAKRTELSESLSGLASDALNLNELAICSSTGRAASASSFAVPLHAQSSRGKRPAS